MSVTSAESNAARWNGARGDPATGHSLPCETRRAAFELTPVSIWAPAFDQAGFKWLKTMPVEQVFEGPLKDYRVEGMFCCRLCNGYLGESVREIHAARHFWEYRQWKREQKAQPELSA